MEQYTFHQAEEAAREAFHSGYEIIQRGRNNWVFIKGDAILLVPKHPRVKSYDIRVAATKKLESNNIPVAKVIQYAPSRLGKPECLVIRRVDGESVDLKKTTLKEREMIHVSAGETLRAINKIKDIEGYGRMNAQLKGDCKTWGEFIVKYFEESLKRLQKNASLWNSYADPIIKNYEKGVRQIVLQKKPVFLHADFHINNLLFKKNRVVAVLDLDIVTSGDPFWDTGHYIRTFNFDREKGIKDFKKGYEVNTDTELERVYSLIIWTRKIGTQARDRPDALKETIPELEKILERKVV